mgnify:CR=1 FL=1|jgi:hypothetical protein
MIIKTNLQILQFLLSNIDSLELGLCDLASKLNTKGKLNINNTVKIIQYIETHRPPLQEPHTLWWPKGEKEPRVEWLKNQIELLEKGDNEK